MQHSRAYISFFPYPEFQPTTRISQSGGAYAIHATRVRGAGSLEAWLERLLQLHALPSMRSFRFATAASVQHMNTTSSAGTPGRQLMRTDVFRAPWISRASLFASRRVLTVALPTWDSIKPRFKQVRKPGLSHSRLNLTFNPDWNNRNMLLKKEIV